MERHYQQAQAQIHPSTQNVHPHSWAGEDRSTYRQAKDFSAIVHGNVKESPSAEDRKSKRQVRFQETVVKEGSKAIIDFGALNRDKPTEPQPQPQPQPPRLLIHNVPDFQQLHSLIYVQAMWKYF